MQLPAGAVSMFGPGTKNLLVEGLKKRQPSTSEESVKSEEVSNRSFFLPLLFSSLFSVS